MSEDYILRLYQANSIFSAVMRSHDTQLVAMVFRHQHRATVKCFPVE